MREGGRRAALTRAARQDPELLLLLPAAADDPALRHRPGRPPGGAPAAGCWIPLSGHLAPPPGRRRPAAGSSCRTSATRPTCRPSVRRPGPASRRARSSGPARPGGPPAPAGRWSGAAPSSPSRARHQNKNKNSLFWCRFCRGQCECQQLPEGAGGERVAVPPPAPPPQPRGLSQGGSRADKQSGGWTACPRSTSSR